MQKQWITWSNKQNFRPEDELAFAPFNRLTWYARTGWKRPYPGDSKVITPEEVSRCSRRPLSASRTTSRSPRRSCRTGPVGERRPRT